MNIEMNNETKVVRLKLVRLVINKLQPERRKKKIIT